MILVNLWPAPVFFAHIPPSTRPVGSIPQITVHIYLGYHSVCPLVRIGILPPLSRKRVCTPTPEQRGGGSQFGRLEIKPILCILSFVLQSLSLWLSPCIYATVRYASFYKDRYCHAFVLIQIVFLYGQSPFF